MRITVTILSSTLTLAALFALGCARGGGTANSVTNAHAAANAGAPTCKTQPVSAESIAAEAKVMAWQRDLPAIFKYDFERSTDKAVMAIPVCVKSADSIDQSEFVTTTGILIPTASISLEYDYMFTPRRNRVMKLEITRQGTSWRGSQFEDSLLHTFTGLREVDLDLPTCTAADLGRPSEVRFVAPDGRVSKVSGLVDSPETLNCN